MSDLDRYRQAIEITPLGSQTRSKAPGHVGPRDRRSGYPLFAFRGSGPYLFCLPEDPAGSERRYLDFVGSNAAVPLGYGRPEVVEAVAEAVGTGNLLSLACELEIDVSQRLCEALGGVQKVRWVKTGSEAMSAAVRLARAATGATAVIVGEHSYHGWADWTLARFGDSLAAGSHALPNGVPSALAGTIHTYKWGSWHYQDDADSIESAVLSAHRAGQRVAAIVVEPDRLMLEQKPQLLEARRVADRYGAVLIFDEMVFGFRWALGGATDYYGVMPDLRCYGKALGNGVPVACVCGRGDLMDRCVPTFISGTYGADRIGLAAARAVLGIYQREPVIERLWSNGRLFFEIFAHTLHRSSSEVGRLMGFPVHFSIRWDGPDQADRVLTTCAENGVLFHRDANNLSAAMTEDEVVLGAQTLAHAFLDDRQREEQRRREQDAKRQR